MNFKTPKPVSLTLATCIAVGVAAGVALARPPSGGNSTIPSSAHSGPSSHGSSVGGAVASGQYGKGRQPSPRPGSENPSAQPQITISDFTFAGNFIVESGTTVTVSNIDSVPHSLTSDNKSFDTGVFEPGTSATFIAPSTPGTYPFFCTVHPGMKGSLIVTS